MNAEIKSLLYNIIGGIVVSILTAILIYIRHKLRLMHLQRILGFPFEKNTDVRIVYGKLYLPPLKDNNGKSITHPYVKASRKGGAQPLQGTFSIDNPVSECEVRASSYLASLLGKSGNINALLVSDTDSNSVLESNFLSLGGPGSNYKTADILASDSNVFIKMDHNHFSLVSGQKLPYQGTIKHDYGFILRISPPDYPEKAWIVCCGLGEWGTSGAAWYISKRWRRMMKDISWGRYFSGFLSMPDYLIILRVTRGQDESAIPVAIYRKDKTNVKKIK